jgi:hypothetical protein
MKLKVERGKKIPFSEIRGLTIELQSIRQIQGLLIEPSDGKSVECVIAKVREVIHNRGPYDAVTRRAPTGILVWRLYQPR